MFLNCLLETIFDECISSCCRNHRPVYDSRFGLTVWAFSPWYNGKKFWCFRHLIFYIVGLFISATKCRSILMKIAELYGFDVKYLVRQQPYISAILLYHFTEYIFINFAISSLDNV